ncbi:hypothetical protein EDD15DRAFT_2200002 [Pisolithus albus]|nr:hypothetical protein EDD15DRAFT_2200002 [Pisolithus albus]
MYSEQNGYEVCKHTCNGLCLNPAKSPLWLRRGSSCPQHATSPRKHGKCSDRCPGWGVLKSRTPQKCPRSMKCRDPTESEVIKYLTGNEMADELLRLRSRQEGDHQVCPSTLSGDEQQEVGGFGMDSDGDANGGRKRVSHSERASKKGKECAVNMAVQTNSLVSQQWIQTDPIPTTISEEERLAQKSLADTRSLLKRVYRQMKQARNERDRVHERLRKVTKNLIEREEAHDAATKLLCQYEIQVNQPRERLECESHCRSLQMELMGRAREIKRQIEQHSCPICTEVITFSFALDDLNSMIPNDPEVAQWTKDFSQKDGSEVKTYQARLRMKCGPKCPAPNYTITAMYWIRLSTDMHLDIHFDM